MMFDESTDWGGAELDSSLSEALLEKPVATPTKKSKNKYRQNTVEKKRVLRSHSDNTPIANSTPLADTPLGKRKRQTKNKNKLAKGEKKVRHQKCAVFDDYTSWEDVIAKHEEEDPSNENLAQFVSSAAEQILKENAPLDENKKKRKKKGQKKVKFVDEQNLLSKSTTEGAGSALSNLNLQEEELESVTESTSSSLQSAKEKITKLKGKFQKRMDASQFRFINEKLYTTSGTEAMELFSKKPELFDVYHRGFTNQVEKWDVNPVDRIIEFIRKSGENTTVADFGCGDAKIARSLTNAVFSFDLVKCNEHVIVANSAKVPLGDKSVDIAVFCLSLMGTDFKDFIREARRVLRSKGKLVVAEVTSRIDDIDVLKNGIEELGFSLLKKSEPNTYFVELVFKKVKPKENKGKFEGLLLKPCTYKKR